MDDYCYECTGYGDDWHYDEELDEFVSAMMEWQKSEMKLKK